MYPLLSGEQFSDKWDTNELIENRLIDYSRATLQQTAAGYWNSKRLGSDIARLIMSGMIPHLPDLYPQLHWYVLGSLESDQMHHGNCRWSH